METFHPKTIEIENVFHIKVTKNLRVEAAANKTRPKDRKAFEYPSYLFTDIDCVSLETEEAEKEEEARWPHARPSN